MKKSYHPLLCTFFCGLMFAACSSSKKEATVTPTSDSTAVTITVDLQNYPAIPYDSVIDNISFVKLETGDDCLVGEVSQLLCTDSLIFVVDYKGKSILSFDKRGKFLRKIGGVGQGPGEYYGSRLCNITLSPDEKELLISDFGKLCHYTLDGRFLREERINWDFKEIEFLDDNTLCTFWMSGNRSKPDKPMLNIYEGVDKWRYGAFPTYETANINLSPGTALRKFNGKVYYCNPFSSTFYEVTPDGVEERFRICFEGQEGVRIVDDTQLFDKILQSNIYCEDFTILKDKAVFELRRYIGVGSPFVVYSFNTGKTYCCDLSRTQNPMFAFHFVPDAREGDHNLVVGYQAVHVMNKKQWIYNHPNADKQVLDQLYDGLTEESNPVLFFFHMKEDL